MRIQSLNFEFRQSCASWLLWIEGFIRQLANCSPLPYAHTESNFSRVKWSLHLCKGGPIKWVAESLNREPGLPLPRTWTSFFRSTRCLARVYSIAVHLLETTDSIRFHLVSWWAGLSCSMISRWAVSSLLCQTTTPLRLLSSLLDSWEESRYLLTFPLCRRWKPIFCFLSEFNTDQRPVNRR